MSVIGNPKRLWHARARAIIALVVMNLSIDLWTRSPGLYSRDFVILSRLRAPPLPTYELDVAAAPHLRERTTLMNRDGR